MACSDQITSEDLENAKTDATFLGEVATSRAGASSSGGVIDESTNRFGEQSDTVAGRLKKMGYAVPINYTAGITFTVNDNVKTVDESGFIYAPLPSSLPFTTSGAWVGDDENKFFTTQIDPDSMPDGGIYKTIEKMQSDESLSAGDTAIVNGVNYTITDTPTVTSAGDYALDNGLNAEELIEDPEVESARFSHRNNVQHSHVESLKISPTSLPVDQSVQPKGIGYAILDTKSNELYAGKNDSYMLLNDVTDIRYFFLTDTNVLTLDSAYTGNVTVTVFPNGNGNTGLHANCPALTDYEWNTVTFAVTAEDTFFTTGGGVYFTGAVKSMAFEGGASDFYYEFDVKTFNYNGATWTDTSGATITQKIDRLATKFYKKGDSTWISENIFDRGFLTVSGADVSQLDNVLTFTNADGTSFADMAPSSRNFDIEAMLDITEISAGAVTADTLGASNRTGRLGRLLVSGIKGDAMVIKRFGSNLTGVVSIDRLNFLLGAL